MLQLAKDATSKNRINLLSTDVANHIAAGEVVARPASIVKELLENSIDAGSSCIDLTIEQGGIAKISVTDNGCGIVKEELELALQQHATSKIKSIEDLDGINSLGFRGEALASIAAVTKLQINSKPEFQDTAWGYSSASSELHPLAHPDGTSIITEDIFYNTPARRKFLRSPRTEGNHIEEIFKRIALSNYAVEFIYNNGGKLVKHLPKAVDMEAKAARIKMLCGSQMLQNSMVIDVEQNGLRLKGWLNSPSCGNNLSQYQFFFLNNRYIRDRLVSAAIRQGFMGFSSPCISYCLYLELPPKMVDINVHPTKHEVRFCDGRVIYAFIEQVVRDGLQKLTGAKLDVVNTTNTFSSNVHMNAGHNSKSIKRNMSSYAAVLSAEPEVIKEHNNEPAEDAGSNLKVQCVIDNTLAIVEDDVNLFIIDIVKSYTAVILEQLQQEFSVYKKIKFIQLKTPILCQGKFLDLIDILSVFGWHITPAGDNLVTIRAVPKLLENFICYQNLLQQLLDSFVKKQWGIGTEQHAFALIAKAYAYHKARDISTAAALELAGSLMSLDLGVESSHKAYRILAKECMLDLI